MRIAELYNFPCPAHFFYVMQGRASYVGSTVIHVEPSKAWPAVRFGKGFFKPSHWFLDAETGEWVVFFAMATVDAPEVGENEFKAARATFTAQHRRPPLSTDNSTNTG